MTNRHSKHLHKVQKDSVMSFQWRLQRIVVHVVRTQRKINHTKNKNKYRDLHKHTRTRKGKETKDKNQHKLRGLRRTKR